MTSSAFIAALAASLVLPLSNADAQTYADGVKTAAAMAPARPPAPAIRESLANLDYNAIEVLPKTPAVQASSGTPQRSLSRKVAGGAVGAVAGFFAGRYFGLAIGGHGGAIIGGPVGAIAGGILGAKY